MKTNASFKEVVAFHGHACPGLAMGYRVATAAIKALDLARSKDEELVAVVENDACGVDAIQYMLGCTFGKGNLIFRDYGKHVFTVMRRDTKQGVRIVADFPRPQGEDQEELSAILARVRKGEATNEEQERWLAYKARKTELVLQADESEVLTIERAMPELPPKARLADSVHCDSCGEKVMATKMVERDGRKFCIPCSNL
jgi:formylmethanofuran dehydrogenase subunit E